jgi:drug/metabolite transporter (DMT)-like permease
LTHSRTFPYWVLLGGVLIAATSSIMVRLLQNSGVPSLVVTAWRLILAVIILTPLAWRRRGDELRRLTPFQIKLAIAAGVMLAFHLATWISSLAFTSVASSVALVNTNPLWIGLVVYFVLGERLSRFTIIGVGLALVGSILVALSDGGVLTVEPGAATLQVNWQKLATPAGKTDTALLGDGLALLGAALVSGYLLVGRRLRPYMSTLSYVWVVYTAAMVTMVIVIIVAQQPLLGYAGWAYLGMLWLALGPQLLSHTSYNWALAHLSTTFVALAILGEPLGAAIFAYFFFGESFVPVQLAGFVFLLAGIALGALGES